RGMIAPLFEPHKAYRYCLLSLLAITMLAKEPAHAPREETMNRNSLYTRAIRIRRELLGGCTLLAGVLAVAAAPPALAQGDNPDTGAEEAEASEQQGNAILVTARRREESLQETPIAISAF